MRVTTYGNFAYLCSRKTKRPGQALASLSTTIETSTSRMTKGKRWLAATCAAAGVLCASAQEPLRLTLEQLFATAESHNTSIQAAQTAVEAAAQGVETARAAWRPDVEATAAMSYMGNVKKDGLQSIMQSGPLMENVCTGVGKVAEANSKCGNCEYFKYCTGGCRVIALALTKDLLGPDLSKCAFFKHGWYKDNSIGKRIYGSHMSRLQQGRV